MSRLRDLVQLRKCQVEAAWNKTNIAGGQLLPNAVFRISFDTAYQVDIPCGG